MKYAVLYETAEDGLAKAPANIAGHSACLAEFRGRGTLLMGGVFADPREGALIIFTTREAAEEFVQRDPFISNGVVRTWRIHAWNETQFRDTEQTRPMR
jgi:uncharacterized protein YciI